MPHIFTNAEYAHMMYVYGFCDVSVTASVEEYRRRFHMRRIPDPSVFYKVFNIRGVAIKKPDSCSNPSLKKIRQSKCYPLQCSPLPDPYTSPCEFSTVGSSAAGHLVLCCSRVASLLLSLHPRTQTWFL